MHVHAAAGHHVEPGSKLTRPDPSGRRASYLQSSSWIGGALVSGREVSLFALVSPQGRALGNAARLLCPRGQRVRRADDGIPRDTRRDSVAGLVSGSPPALEGSLLGWASVDRTRRRTGTGPNAAGVRSGRPRATGADPPAGRARVRAIGRRGA